MLEAIAVALIATVPRLDRFDLELVDVLGAAGAVVIYTWPSSTTLVAPHPGGK